MSTIKSKFFAMKCMAIAVGVVSVAITVYAAVTCADVLRLLDTVKTKVFVGDSCTTTSVCNGETAKLTFVCTYATALTQTQIGIGFDKDIISIYTWCLICIIFILRRRQVWRITACFSSISSIYGGLLCNSECRRRDQNNDWSEL